MKLIITESQYRILSEAYSEEEFREKYIESGLVPENQFNEIISEFNKPFYIGWILKMLSSGFIKYEDVYKFKNYFNVFEKFKQHYPIKDLGQIKTFNDVEEFERKSKDILIKQQETEQGDISDKKNLVSVNDIQKLESVGIKYLGMDDGLQVFQVPSKVKDSKEAWNVYREILGKCSGRDKGQIVSICTIQGFNFFQDYFTRYPGSSYYVFYNMGDSLSPYQIHYETNQYKDKNDDDISINLKAKFTKFLLTKDLSENIIPIFLKKIMGLKLDKSTLKSINQIESFFKNFVDECEINLEQNKITNNSLDISIEFIINYNGTLRISDGSSILAYKYGVEYKNGLGVISNEVLVDLLKQKFPNLKFGGAWLDYERQLDWSENTQNSTIRSMRINDNKRKEIEMFIKNNPQLVENINNSLDEKYKSKNITSKVRQVSGDEYFNYYLPNDVEPFLIYTKKNKIAHWVGKESSFIQKIKESFKVPNDILSEIISNWCSKFLKLPVKRVSW